MMKNEKEHDDTLKNNKDNIEVVDLGTSKKKVNKKSNIIIIIILLIIILFIVFLPYINKLIKGDNNYHYNTGETTEKDSENLVDGLIPLNVISYMKVQKIKFYNFNNKVANKIDFSIISQENKESVNNLNIYLELYNSKKKMIYRTKFLSDKKLERGILERGELVVSNNVFKKSVYAKVVEDKKEEVLKENFITCRKETVNKALKISETNVYNFYGKYLVSYNYTKSISSDDIKSAEYLEGISNIKELYDDISKSNIVLQGDVKEDNKINFIVDLNTYEAKDSKYKVMYGKNDTINLVNEVETESGWKCE
ncbi:MAG: hypothetical protein RR228_00895 [Bacilli bacterium]